MNLRYLLASFAASGAMLLSSSKADAGLNDYGCKSPGRLPVVIAHGRSGTAASMVDIINSLNGAGYCVFGEDYGRIAGKGQTGMAHLDQSGGEFAAVVQKVMNATGAPKVNVVGYSEGASVIDNFLLAKGGASKVYRMVSFAGGHHPYGHAGLAGVFDGILYLPNTIEGVRNSAPPFTSNISYQDVIAASLGLAPGALSPADEELVRSEFVEDLFTAEYWIGLHGSLSEAKGTVALAGTTVRTLPTKDSSPSVCYTNMISPADTLVGASTGYLDEASNVANVLLPSTADHGTIIGDKVALGVMVAAFATPCTPSPNGGAADGGKGGGFQLEGHSEPPNGSGQANGGGADPDDDGSPSSTSGERDGRAVPSSSGCGYAVLRSSSSAGSFAGFAAIIGFAFLRRRRRSSSPTR